MAGVDRVIGEIEWSDVTLSRDWGRGFEEKYERWRERTLGNECLNPSLLDAPQLLM